MLVPKPARVRRKVHRGETGSLQHPPPPSLLGMERSGGKRPAPTPAPKYLWPPFEAGIRRINSLREGQELEWFAALG